MELFPSPGECSYQNGSAVICLLCFGFFSRERRYGTTKEAKYLDSLGAFNRLPFSLFLHYKSFHAARGHSRSRGCRRLLKWRLCKMLQNGSAVIYLLCFGFFSRERRYGTTKEAKYLDSLGAFNRLPFSLSLHYKSFHAARGHSRSREIGRA